MSQPPRPNLFILGAPKCGTTSLAAWLAAHPRIYMCPVKEPCYFNTDHHANRGYWTARKYEALFRGAAGDRRVIGEASVWYLYSQVAVDNILQYNPDARFIVCLRNPVAMAPSLHEQQVFAGNEHIRDFEEAWRIQDERARGRAVTRWCSVPAHLAYGAVCKLGHQVERLAARVDMSRVCAVLLEDLAAEPRREYLRLLAFLGVDDDGRQAFARLNASKERRSLLVRRAVQAVNSAKVKLGVPPMNTRLWGLINRLNQRDRPRAPLPPRLQADLAAYFEHDVRTLSRLIGRDLSSWFDPA